MNHKPLLLVCMTLALASCGPEDKKPEAVIRPVLSMAVAQQDSQTNSFLGSVEPRYRNVVSFQIFGRLVSRNVDVGDLVKAGQQLASIDPLALEQSIRASEATLAGARAEYTNAVNTEERKRTLLKTGASTQAELDAAVQALESAKSQVTRSQSELAKARDQLGFARLTASFDGVVTAINAEVGQVVAAGQSVMTIARPDVRDAVVDLPEIAWSLLQIGTAFDIALELDPSIRVSGAIREIAPLADATTRTRRVRIALENPPDGFRLGSTIFAAPNAKASARMLVPAAAILTKQDRQWVWVIDMASKTVSTREVKASPLPHDQMEILSGLTAGERIVTAGVNSLTEKQSVKIAGAPK